MPSLLYLHRAAVALGFKGMAVRALSECRILLMCNHFDLIERTIILVLTVMLALVDGAFNAHICLVILHICNLPNQRLRLRLCQ